jgi:hypothetical protein
MTEFRLLWPMCNYTWDVRFFIDRNNIDYVVTHSRWKSWDMHTIEFSILWRVHNYVWEFTDKNSNEANSYYASVHNILSFYGVDANVIATYN